MTTTDETKSVEVDLSEPQINAVGQRLLRVDGHTLDQREGVASKFPERVAVGRDAEAVSRGRWRAQINSDVTSTRIGDFHFEDIDPSIAVLSFRFKVSWNQFIEAVSLLWQLDLDARETRYLIFELNISTDGWANPYTLKDYVAELQMLMKEGFEFRYCNDWNNTVWPSYEGDGPGKPLFNFVTVLSLSVPVRSSATSIKDELQHWSEKFEILHEQTERNLLRDNTRTLVTFFNFPEHLKTSCGQYLLYFAQFLEDLGLSAESEVRNHAGSVMFSVTPKDGETALTNIETALGIYLSLPSAHEFTTVSNQFQDIAVAQLRANVLFLRSQLELAWAVGQAKDATIEALNFTIFQQRQFLTDGINSTAHYPLKSLDAENEEPLLGDTVYVTKIEGKGFKVDLPLILRRLKRAFRGSRD